jgi:hypothetical protein
MGEAPQPLDALEPIYTLAVACELIPMPSMPALYQWLHNHKEEFKPRYRQGGGRHRPQRMLLESEILKIRAMTIKEGSPFVGSGRKKKASILDVIIARATGNANRHTD